MTSPSGRRYGSTLISRVPAVEQTDRLGHDRVVGEVRPRRAEDLVSRGVDDRDETGAGERVGLDHAAQRIEIDPRRERGLPLAKHRLHRQDHGRQPVVGLRNVADLADVGGAALAVGLDQTHRHA
jgi:hypothetical protein